MYMNSAGATRTCEGSEEKIHLIPATAVILTAATYEGECDYFCLALRRGSDSKIIFHFRECTGNHPANL
jgi:hypothetical protein